MSMTQRNLHCTIQTDIRTLSYIVSSHLHLASQSQCTTHLIPRMLRFKHWSSSSSSPANHMDVTVLQRQRDLLQRLHQQSNSLLQNQEMECCRFHVQSALQNQSYSVVSNSDCSSIRKASEQGRQCNSSLLTREMKRADKRKAEFDIEEENQENLVDSEEAGDEKSEITVKTEREASTNTGYKGCSKVQKPDFIHVRARRGQATDSHSLAERARREKISKKMKCLQDLVPGCNKVTGKAGMLDEIINYVQSLQKQVEFLSMKLATLNPRLDFGMENFFAKEAAADIGCLLPSRATAAAQFEPIFHYNTMQPYNSAADIAVDPSQTSPGKIGNEQLPGWELDWTSMFNAGFH